MGEFIDRCQLVLLANPVSVTPELLTAAADGGHISSAILYQAGASAPQFFDYCETVVPELQARDVAVLVADNTQACGRSNADGLFLEKTRDELERVIEQHAPQKIVGCGGFKNRDAALRLGEAKPDFMLFGKLGGDIRAEAHPKNLALAQWWAEMIEIPCVVLAGNSLESVVECAASGADFVAVERCIFDAPEGPEMAVSRAEALLEKHAPRFEEVAP